MLFFLGQLTKCSPPNLRLCWANYSFLEWHQPICCLIPARKKKQSNTVIFLDCKHPALWSLDLLTQVWNTVGILHLLLSDKLRQGIGCAKSCAVIGYPNGQDSAVLPARDYTLCPARKIFRKPRSWSHTINSLLTKFVRWRWLDIGLVLTFSVDVPQIRLGSVNTKKLTWPASNQA